MINDVGKCRETYQEFVIFIQNYWRFLMQLLFQMPPKIVLIQDGVPIYYLSRRTL